MLQQFVEVPVFSIKDGDIIYSPHHDLLQIVIDVIIPPNIFENEDANSTISLWAINAETYNFDKNNGGSIAAYEVIPLRSNIYKLITITNEDIINLGKVRDEVLREKRKDTISSFQVVYDGSEKEELKRVKK